MAAPCASSSLSRGHDAHVILRPALRIVAVVLRLVPSPSSLLVYGLCYTPRVSQLRLSATLVFCPPPVYLRVLSSLSFCRLLSSCERGARLRCEQWCGWCLSCANSCRSPTCRPSLLLSAWHSLPLQQLLLQDVRSGQLCALGARTRPSTARERRGKASQVPARVCIK